MSVRSSAALLPVLAVGLGTLASAQEYCVVCFDPPARYRCMVAAEPGTAPSPSRSQFLCITQLAQTGQHASCAVGRTSAEPCDGELRTVMVPNTTETPLPPEEAWQPDPVAPGTQAPTQSAEQMPPDEQPPAEAPPETVEELAKQTVEASGKGLAKAGDAVSDTAQSAGKAVTKTWKCLSSFFSDC
jgi:hypothetical protein